MEKLTRQTHAVFTVAESVIWDIASSTIILEIAVKDTHGASN